MPYLLLTLAACFWGGNYVVGRVLVTQADPMIISEGRWVLTALLLLCLYHQQLGSDLPKIKKSIWPICLLAIFGQILFPLTLYIGLQYTSSLNASIYLSATPCMVLVMNKLLFNDTISKNNILGVLFSTIGVIYLILQGNLTNLTELSNINKGDLWAMASALSWACYSAFLRLKDKSISGNAFVTISAVLGSAMLLPIALVYFYCYPVSNLAHYTTPDFLLGLLYIAIFASWLSYLFWNKGIVEIGATRGQIYTHIIPLSAGIFSIVFLHTAVAYFHLVSIVFIVIGIYFCSKK
ncbi:DMT family transporter [Gilliamella sp. ESL0250]|uniref:DMT family transporter n=1 Tax=Gilliamella sp. ESL0250 TaxID=2705036 RepID=UPI0015808A8F|nr:DMT family transporter [Gilliamella sp. ESL0250]NUF48486.1 DMT family transporter [Gilliamella sp. ESL0250]